MTIGTAGPAPRRARALVFAIAVLAYLPAFWWGTPYATTRERADPWGVDDSAPLGALAHLHDLVTPGPAPNPTLGYPLLHPLLMVGTFAPYLVYLRVTGGLGTPTQDFPHGFADPPAAIRVMAWLAHLLSVVMAAGVVLAAWELGRLLWGARAARWSAAFVLLSYPMFYYSRTANVDMPVLCFTAWGLVAFTRCVMLGVTPRRVAALGALAGMAMATKEPSFASFVGIPVVLLLIRWGPDGMVRSAGGVARVAAIGITCTLAAYAIGSGALADPDRWIAHIEFARTRVGELVAGEVAFATYYPTTLDGHWQLLVRLVTHLRESLTLPGLLLSLVGIVVAARRAPRTALFAVPIATYLLVLFFSARAAQLRYVMPAAFGLAVFAGYAAVHTFDAARDLPGRLVRLAAVAALALAALRGLDLTHAMLRDSRYSAARWFSQVASPGDRLEYFGAAQKNPPLPAFIELGRAVEYRGGWIRPPIDDETAERIRAGWRERNPRFIVLAPDYTSRPGEPYAATCPPQIFEDLEAGRLGFVRVRLFETPALLPWIARPPLDYPVVNPPIRVYVRADDPTVAAVSR